MGRDSYLGGSSIDGKWSDHGEFGSECEIITGKGKRKGKQKPSNFRFPPKPEPERIEPKAKQGANEASPQRIALNETLAKRNAALMRAGYPPLPKKPRARARMHKEYVEAGVLLPDGKINPALARKKKRR